MPDYYTRLVGWILKTTVGTLASIVVIVVAALLMGLFNDHINNEDIFAVIGPAFNTVIGAFVGLLGGISLNFASSKKQQELPEEETPIE